MRLVIGAAALIGLALAACSPPAQEKSAEAPTTETTETVETPTPEATTETTAPEATATTIELDITDATGARLSGDTARGQRIFAQCQTCHTIQAGVNRVGPSLHGIIGRHSGTVPGFRYSDANRNSGITWTEQELFNYLENPRARIPGTIMSFVGLRQPQQRADVIAYLKANTAD